MVGLDFLLQRFFQFQTKLMKKGMLSQTDKKFIQFPSVCLVLFNFVYTASIALFFFKWYLCRLKPQKINESSKITPFNPRLLALV